MAGHEILSNYLLPAHVLQPPEFLPLKSASDFHYHCKEYVRFFFFSSLFPQVLSDLRRGCVPRKKYLCDVYRNDVKIGEWLSSRHSRKKKTEKKNITRWWMHGSTREAERALSYFRVVLTGLWFCRTEKFFPYYLMMSWRSDVDRNDANRTWNKQVQVFCSE